MPAPDRVLLHGFTLTGASWKPVIDALPPADALRARAPDIRGHGRASERRPVTLEAVLGDLAAVAPERFELVGYSMGGRLALHAALQPGLRERVTTLTLIGASPGIADPEQRERRRAADEELAAQIERLPIEAVAERWARTPVLAGQPADVRAAAHADRLRSTPGGLAAALRGLGTGALPSLWDRLGDLELPVRLVVGERDAKFRALAEAMAARISGASIAVVPGAGHAAGLEAPSGVADLLVAGG